MASGPTPDSLLVVDDEDGAVEEAALAAGSRVVHWRRRAGPAHITPAAWPPDTPVAGASVRLPKGRKVLEMTLHASLARVETGGPVWLYGANDEGIRSAGRALGALCDDIHTLDTRHHCRVWRGRRSSTAARGSLEDWRVAYHADLPGGPAQLVSFPGLFSHGRLDPATSLLAEAMPELGERARALDFGCGAGLLALALRQHSPTTELHLLDRDALAIRAAKSNLPGAVFHLGDGWRTVPGELRFDLVVSNPPIHQGVTRDDEVIRELVNGAADRLAPAGLLLLVAQRTVPVPRWTEPRFREVAIERDDRSFRVWRARRPRR